MWIIKTSQSIPHRAIVIVCSEIHIKYLYVVCRQNVEFSNVTFVVYKVFETAVL